MASTEFGKRSQKGAGFLFLLGFGLIALGVGFAFAPQYSWQVTKIAQKASALGLQNGALVVGGLVTFALGIVARVASSGSTSSSIDPRPEIEALQSEMHIHNEQFSTKLAQLRTALMQVNDSVTTVAANQAALHTETEKPASSGDHSQDAVFRLAASLDKLHAHLDERVHAVDLQLRSGFETLLGVSQDLRRHLESGHVGSAAPETHVAAASHHHAHQAHQAHAPHAASHGHVAHGHATQPQPPESGIDFYQTMQKLDAIAGESGAEAPAQPDQPQAPFPSQGVDALDALLPEEYRDRY